MLYINIVSSDHIKQYKYFYFYTCTKCESQTIYRHNTGSHHPAPVQCSFFQWLVVWKGNFAKNLNQCCILILCCQNKEKKKKKTDCPSSYWVFIAHKGNVCLEELSCLQLNQQIIHWYLHLVEWGLLLEHLHWCTLSQFWMKYWHSVAYLGL